MHYLEFERPIAELEGKILELRKLAEEDPGMDIDAEVTRLWVSLPFSWPIKATGRPRNRARPATTAWSSPKLRSPARGVKSSKTRRA